MTRAIAALFVVLAPLSALAEEPQTKPAKDPTAPLYTGADIGKAVDGMTRACATAQAQHARIQQLVAARGAAQTELREARRALDKHLKAVRATQDRLKAEAKRGGPATDPLIESARASFETAASHEKTVEKQTESLRKSDAELSDLVSVADEATKACEAHEATLRAAAAAARVQVSHARAAAEKARVLAKLAPAESRELEHARNAKQLEELKSATNEARAELEIIEEVAADAKKEAAQAEAKRNAASAAAKSR